MKLALELPWGAARTEISPAYTPTEVKFPADFFTLAKAINSFSEVAIFIGAFLMIFWAGWGVFDYIRAEGNKEALAKARKRIQWAIVGFFILVISFFISDYLMPLLAGRINRPLDPLSF